MDRPLPARALARLLPLLCALVVACTTAPPEGSPTPTPTQESTPTSAASPTAQPTLSLGPTPTLLPTPTAAPTATPSSTPTLAPTPSPTPAAGLTPQVRAELDATLVQQLARYGIPGMSAVVIMPDGERWEGAAGDAATSPARPADVGTPFVIGSITKTFVAALTMQLAEEGVLNLDAPLAEWLPDFPRARRITLRHLLAHTSGVFNHFEHSSYNRLVFGTDEHEWTPQEILDTFVIGAGSYCAPGTCYHYSNTGYVLLGIVIEKATGNSLGEEFMARFFEPLGLDDTYFQGDHELPADAAEGHLRRVNGTVRQVSDGSDLRPTTSAATVAWAAGAMVSSAPGIADWARALYAGELLSAESMAQMTDFAGNPYSGTSYGLGTRTRLVDGWRMVGHTGSLRGFTAAMWHVRDAGITVVVLDNLGRIDPNRIADEFARIGLRAAGSSSLSLPTPAPLPSPTATASATP